MAQAPLDEEVMRETLALFEQFGNLAFKRRKL